MIFLDRAVSPSTILTKPKVNHFARLPDLKRSLAFLPTAGGMVLKIALIGYEDSVSNTNG